MADLSFNSPILHFSLFLVWEVLKAENFLFLDPQTVLLSLLTPSQRFSPAHFSPFP